MLYPENVNMLKKAKSELKYVINNRYLGNLHQDVDLNIFEKLIEYTEKIKNELDKYKNVEKELGIDLITLAKIQEEGVYVKEHIDFELEDSFEYSYFLPTEIRVNFKEKKLLLYFEDIHDVLYSLDFNQYGKQFAVTKEELEKNG